MFGSTGVCQYEVNEFLLYYIGHKLM